MDANALVRPDDKPPFPDQCIWCRRGKSEVTFKSESHVWPAALGNDSEILPPGIVCDKCNHGGFRKLEAEQLEDPLGQVLAWALRLGNARARKLAIAFFDPDGQRLEPPNDLQVHVSLPLPNRLEVKFTAGGQRGMLERDYPVRLLALLSRAKHKIAFESLARAVYVKDGTPGMLFDLLDPSFDHVRAWARYGQPQSPIRPFFRPYTFQESVILPPKIGPAFANVRGRLLAGQGVGIDLYREARRAKNVSTAPRPAACAKQSV